jgi:hypothetical protein
MFTARPIKREHDFMIDNIFALSNSIRYVARYDGDQLETKSKAGTVGASTSETDRYEELLVNPTLLKLSSQRGNIDCGGLRYVLVRYGNFFQFVLPTQEGHISVCIESDADPVEIGNRISALVQGQCSL